MSYRIIGLSEVEQSPLSWWQSSNWADILTESLQVQEVFYFGSLDTSYILIEIRSIGLGLSGAFSLGISASQIGSDWEDMIVVLQQELRTRNILFLQIEPLDTDISHKNIQQPYKKFLTLHTRVLDLTLTEDELLAQMHEKGRYNIRLAGKRGVTVERVDATSENIDIWMGLLADTLTRDRFSGNSRSYYETFLYNLAKTDRGGLYFAWFGGRVIAGGIYVFTPSRAIYYYGASSSLPDDRKQMAPYLLQWTAICIAKNKQIPIYDFLGIADPSDPSDSLRGVTEFKEKFGGNMITLPSKVLYPLSWKYSIFRVLQAIKNLLKRR